MADKLFTTNDRDESHRFLDKVLGSYSGPVVTESSRFRSAFSLILSGQYPRAECRENPNDETGRYQVWSDSDAG